MKLEKQILDDHQAKLTVEIEPEMFDEAKRRAARKIAKEVKIPGFRPGKAPYNVIERFVGEGAIVEEAMETLVNEIYPKALEEAQIEPYGPGELNEVPSMDPVKFEFLVPLDPVATLGDYRALRLPYETPVVTDEDVQKVLEDLRRRQSTLTPIERAAETGDLVVLRLSSTRKNPAEGQEAVLVRERRHQATILAADVNKSDEWPYPGFSRELVGLAADAQKNIDYTYPEDSVYEGLRGQSVEFHLEVDEVKSRTLPELNDEFAKTIGEYETLEALTREIRSGLEAQRKEEYDDSYLDQITSELVAGAKIQYPPQMVEHELDHVVERLKDRLGQQNLDMETYLKSRSMDMEAFRAEARPVAENRIRRSLAVMEVGRAEDIKVEKNEVEEEANRTLMELARVASPQQAKKMAKDDDLMFRVVGEIASEIILRRTYDRLIQIAKGEYTAEQPAGEEQPTSEAQAPTDETTVSAPESASGE